MRFQTSIIVTEIYNALNTGRFYVTYFKLFHSNVRSQPQTTKLAVKH